MAYTPQLFYGKLSSFTALNDNITVITGTVQSGNSIISNVAAFNASFDVSVLRVGQILNDVSSAFPTSNVTILEINGSNITVSEEADVNGTGKIFPADTPEGVYYFKEAPFVDPNNNLTVLNVTGSDEAIFDSSLTNTFSILGRAKKGSSLQNGVFLNYEISEVTDRTAGKLSGFIKWGANGSQSDSGFTLDLASSRIVPIVETTPTTRKAPMFDTSILTGLSTVGSGFAGWQEAVLGLDTGGSGAGFPFSGSAHITGSLIVTGSTEFLKDPGSNEDFFLIKSASFSSLKMNRQGIPVFGNFTSTPTPVAGGLIFSASSFYAGLE
jgi:hypothetical protein